MWLYYSIYGDIGDYKLEVKSKVKPSSKSGSDSYFSKQSGGLEDKGNKLLPCCIIILSWLFSFVLHPLIIEPSGDSAADIVQTINAKYGIMVRAL